jgi:DNA-binding ferritin-like protein
MFPDFSKLDELGKSLTAFMDEVRERLAAIESDQKSILEKLNEVKP